MPQQAFPPGTNSAVQNIIQAYAYVQYQDDDEIQAFFQAYNIYAQAYLTYINNLSLEVYSRGNISGHLLDWEALGIYGFIRPAFSTIGKAPKGPFNTWRFNRLPFNTLIPGVLDTYTLASDDIFKRVMTWHLYKGDGKYFTVDWLKQRIYRFLFGVNGTDPPYVPYDISVQLTGRWAATITVPNGGYSPTFVQAAQQSVIELPFQYTWTIQMAAANLTDSDGLDITDSDGLDIQGVS
jgi:hypothetical protein